jgi:hypothetical protein
VHFCKRFHPVLDSVEALPHGPLRIAVAITLAVLALAIAIYLALVGGPRQETLGKVGEKSMNATSGAGIVTTPSHHSVDETVEKLEQILQAKGVKLFGNNIFDIPSGED